MKKLTLLFIFAAFSIGGFSQSRASLLKTALLNATAPDTFLLRDSVLCYLSGDLDSDSLFLWDLVKAKLINTNDEAYMKQQLAKNNHSTWSKDSIAGAVILQSAGLPASALSAKKAAKAWTSYFKLHNQGYYEVGKPLMSRDGMTAIVYTAFQCGAKCGNGGATLFHWENGKWVSVKNIYSWRK